MGPKISPDTKYGLVLQDGDETVYCVFKRDERHPESLDSSIGQIMYLTAPKPVPDTYRYEGEDEIGENQIAFVAFDEDHGDPYSEFRNAYNMVMIEVTNGAGDPAIDFVRMHAEGGTIQEMANDLFASCFFKMMADHGKKVLN